MTKTYLHDYDAMSGEVIVKAHKTLTEMCNEQFDKLDAMMDDPSVSDSDLIREEAEMQSIENRLVDVHQYVKDYTFRKMSEKDSTIQRIIVDRMFLTERERTTELAYNLLLNK